MKLPLESDIGLRGSKTAQHVASEIALLSGERCGERGLVEYLSTGILRTVEYGGDTWNHIGSRVESCPPGKGYVTDDVHRRGRARQKKHVQRPAAQKVPDRFARFGRRQLIRYTGCERMADVEV